MNAGRTLQHYLNFADKAGSAEYPRRILDFLSKKASKKLDLGGRKNKNLLPKFQL